VESAHFRQPDRRPTPHRLPRRELATFLLAATLATLRAQTPARDAANPAAANGALRGRVVAAESREPIRKARVDLLPSTGDWRDSVYADTDGRFEFRAVPGGRYTLSAWKSGYAPTRFGTRTFWEPAAVIAIDAGQVLDGFEIVIAKGAAVSGRVADDAGEAVTDMTVSIGRAAEVDGRLQFQPLAQSATTDDRGEYRIGGLPPGSYVVSVFGRTGPSVPIPGSEAGFRARNVFYPQTPFLSQARPVVLRAGEEVGSVDVAFTAETLVMPAISGRVIDPRGGGVNAALLVTSSGDGVAAAVRSQFSVVQESGEFNVRLVPGDYTLFVQADGMVARTRLTVDRTDISNVELLLAKGATVSGRVVFEGGARRPTALEVMARPADRPALDVVGVTPRPARVRGDGSFSISSLLGPLELRVAPESRSWRPKSILLGGRNVLDVPLDFKAGEEFRDVTIVLSDRTASLGGTVANVSAPLTTGLSVLVFPGDPRQAARRARWIRTDQHGRFLVSDLSPGDYFVAVAAAVDDSQWQTPAYLDHLRAGATRVTLGDGESKTIRLESTELR
jgi:hypothetical protein